MRSIALALLFLSARAMADGRLVQPPPRAMSHPSEGLCDHVLHSARLGITSGKVVIMERGADGRPQPLGARLGDARIVPAFDLSFHSASMVARVVF